MFALVLILPAISGAQTQTPPIPPKTMDTPVPPKIELPPPPVTGETAPVRPLTADEAVQIAFRLQPSIQVAQEGVNAAKGRSQQSRAGLLPTVSLNVSYNNVTSLLAPASGSVTNNGTNSGSTNGGNNGNTGGNNGNTGGTTGGTNSGNDTGNNGTNNGIGNGNLGSVGGLGAGYQAGVTVRQLIYDFNRTRDLVRQSAALERAAGQNLSRVRNDLALQVKQSYYGLVQNQRIVAVNEANLQNRRNQRDLALARLNSGLGLPSDLATAETAYSEAVLTLTLSQNIAEISRVTLATLLGVDPRTPIATASGGETDISATDVNALVTTALRNRPEILQAEENISANRSGVGAARSGNSPTISGVLGATGRGDDSPFANDNFGVGVSIAFSPFDGGLTSGRVREVRANLATSQANLNAAKLTVISDVSQSYLNLKNAEQRVVTADIGVSNASEGVRIAEGRYRAGLGIFLDIINAQTLLLTAQTNQVSAQIAVEQARASLKHALGLNANPNLNFSTSPNITPRIRR